MNEMFQTLEVIYDEKGQAIDFRYLEVNPATEKMVNKSRDEMIGKRAKEIFGVVEDYWIQALSRVVNTGESVHLENYSAAVDKYWDANIFKIEDQPNTVAIILSDISRHKKAEKALRESEENLKRVQSMGNMGNWRLDLQINELVWSDENYKIFGIPKGTQQKYETFIGYVHPEDREYVDKKWKAGLAGDEYDIEHRIIADGMVKWVREKAFLEFDEKGELLAGFGITQDITKRKNAETELERSRIKLDMALENANIGLWEWNVITNEVIWDERSERMLGLEASSPGRTYNEFEKLVHEEDLDHIRKALNNTLLNNAPFEIIFRTKPAEGKPKYISSKALVIRNQTGNITSLTGVNFDITDLKEGTERLVLKLNEDLLRSNKELENFAYIASHDLQEPLRMVTCFTQLLAKQFNETLEDRAKEYIGFAVDAAKQMYDLINGLLEYSRISRKEIIFSEVDMNKIIDSVKANLSLIIKEKNCRIETNDLPVVFAEGNQMIQLFQNLIANGIKFSKNDPHIYISSKTEKTHYLFSVKDEGIGIETAYFDKIFEIFKRLMPKDQYEGTGIGLAICKRIVENHSGKIWVESEPGKGSVFHFTLSKG